MFSSRFFWKVFATCALGSLLTAAVVGWFAQVQLVDALLREKETALRQRCYQMAARATEALKGGAVPDREDLERLAPDVRTTFIRPDGTVLADSQHDPVTMDNHLDRQEVQEALSTGEGVSRRPSHTLQRRLFYVARVPGRNADGTPVGVVRMAIPVDDIEEERLAMRARLGGVALIGVLCAMGVGAFLTRRLTRPLAQLTAVAQDLREGRYDRRTGRLPRDEVGVLGEALNELGVEITQRLSDLSGEEARLRAMLAGMVEGVVAVDEDDRVVFSNRAARRLLGVPELAGRLWESVRVPELDTLVEEARGTDAAATRELTFGDPGRRYLSVQAQAHRFRAEGRIGVVIVLHDLTELRRLERVRRDFVANVSHELKTPLTSIRGYVETLLSGALHDEQNNVRFLEKIDSNVKRLTHLVADLLSLARIESAEGSLPLEPLDLQPLLEQSLRLHGPRATEKGIRCRLEPATERVRVLGDRESLVQVVDNLVDNAIKYTHAGEVRLACRREGAHGVLEVQDTGIGIPADELERVFERFYRVDKARSRELGGTGLGLSIVKHLVGAMHGDVEVRSDHGQGSTFRVRLPLAEPGV